MDYIAHLNKFKNEGKINDVFYRKLEEFYHSYMTAISKNHFKKEDLDPLMVTYLKLIVDQSQNPFIFENFHKAIREPFDYYRFALDVFFPLIQMEKSKVYHEEIVDEIDALLKKGENVVLFANHQVEPDPQVISIMLEKKHPILAEEMIFVAGHRVTTDPVAIPGSKGRNLLCIYSKKHIENPPELKLKKQQHNQKTMQIMGQLFAEGGKCVYVAPSGGRDRKNNDTGLVEVSLFDPQSIEMFWLIARHSGVKTSFYPLYLETYDLFPPPVTVEVELGERRSAETAPVFLSFGKKIDMEHIPGTEGLDKKAQRKVRADYIWNQVKSLAPSKA